MMMEDERRLIRLALARWGSYVAPWDGGRGPVSLSTPVHVLHRARLYAPGTRDRAAKALAGRAGFSRRRIVGGGEELAPEWAVDAVTCAETRARTYSLPQSYAVPAIDLPDELRPLDRAIARLEAVPKCVVTTEFTVRERQKTKAAIASNELKTKMTLRQYRHVLSEAINHLASVVVHGNS